ncbi:hypothetical protein D1872_242530 [compost metagenome]
MTDQPERGHLQPKYGSGQRSAEHRAETAAYAAHQENFSFRFINLYHVSKPLGQTPAHLYRGSFPSRRSAEQVGSKRTQQHQWGHAKRDPFGSVLNAFKN